MNAEEEQRILTEAPDFDNQREILSQEKMVIKKRQRKYILFTCMFVLSVAIFVFSYSYVYHYREYGTSSKDNCSNVNLKIEDSLVPNLNISEGSVCVPMYNIDYFNNRKPLFNIDMYGDRSELFNETNQKDSNGKCIINCDSNNDGWPDYNIDIDGDKKEDLNLSKDGKFCYLNCDINGDMIPDTNIDTDGDGKADVNITDTLNHRKPIKNIDYMGNRVPTFNIETNGIIENEVNSVESNKECTRNCDIDNDGWPDYNITLPGSNEIINELVHSKDEKVFFDGGKLRPWRCYFSRNLDECQTSILTNVNTYNNIDIDGDGKPDVNVVNSNGKIDNKINKVVIENGKKIILNEDRDLDGFPDYNIDIDNDGKPDLNITENGSYNCVKNCDINKDGKADHLIDVGKNQITINNLNIDLNYDGICDLNCDTNYDLNPDLNIDTNGDGLPEINIDYDHDKRADYNVDTNGDNIPDKNIDVYGTGECNFNCDNGNNKNYVSSGNNCTKNCDTNGDGFPDKNVDIDADGLCDINCDGNDDTIDQDNNYFIDNTYGEEITLLEVNNTSGEENFYITNPLSIKEEEIEPGWNGKYVLVVTNNSNQAVKYRLFWSNVINEYTNRNNLDYFITMNRTNYLDGLKAPRKDIVLADNLIIKPKATIKYVLDIRFTETNQNQNIDSGKIFYGHFKLDVIK